MGARGYERSMGSRSVKTELAVGMLAAIGIDGSTLTISTLDGRTIKATNTREGDTAGPGLGGPRPNGAAPANLSTWVRSGRVLRLPEQAYLAMIGHALAGL